MKKPINAEKWGRDTAAKRYASGGSISDTIPTGWQVKGLNHGDAIKQVADWKRQDLMNHLESRAYEGPETNKGQGPTPQNLEWLKHDQSRKKKDK